MKWYTKNEITEKSSIKYGIDLKKYAKMMCYIVNLNKAYERK